MELKFFDGNEFAQANSKLGTHSRARRKSLAENMASPANVMNAGENI